MKWPWGNTNLNRKFLSTWLSLWILRFFAGLRKSFCQPQQYAAYRQFVRISGSYTSHGTRILATVFWTQWRSVLPPRQIRKCKLETYLRNVCSFLRYCEHHWPYFSFTAQKTHRLVTNCYSQNSAATTRDYAMGWKTEETQNLWRSFVMIFSLIQRVQNWLWGL